MVKKMRAERSTGRCAVWDGSDYAPLNDPLNNLSRIKFHSDLNYVRVLYDWASTITFSARTYWATSPNGWRASEGVIYRSIPLFAHGRPGQPWVLGSANIGGLNVAFTGSVPVQRGIASISSDGSPQGGIQVPWARWVTLGADSSSVYLYEYIPVGRDVSTNLSGCYMPAIAIPITVWVTDEILS